MKSLACACSPFPCGVSWTLCQADHSRSVGPSQSWFHHSAPVRKLRNKEIMLMAILVTDGVVDGKLGMVTFFCHSDQVRVEPFSHASDPCSAELTWPSHGGDENLHQFASYFPWGCFSLSFLNIATLPQDAPQLFSSCSHSYACAGCFLCSPNQVILPKEEADANELKSHPNHSRGPVGEIHQGASSIIPGAALSYCICQS